jgi:hypothetical protein
LRRMTGTIGRYRPTVKRVILSGELGDKGRHDVDNVKISSYGLDGQALQRRDRHG